MTKEKVIDRKQNMKIYPLYRAISLDIIFFYAIQILFLTQEKGISLSDVVLSISFYSIFMIIFQIPVSIIIEKIGVKTSTVIANAFNIIFIILIIFSSNFKILLIAQLFSAIASSLKNVSDKALLRYSIPETSKKGEIFSKIEGKGTKDYYLLDAVTATISGFLYVINPYIPLIGSLIFTILATIMSLGFKNIEENKEQQITIKEYIKDFKKGFKFVYNSQRLRSLFLYSGITWGIICLIETYRTSLLINIKTPEQIITIIIAIVGIATAIGSKKQNIFHKQFRNKSLSVILMSITIIILIVGIVAVADISYEFSLFVITIGFIIVGIGKGLRGVLITRYLSNFADNEILTQIYAIDSISINVFRAIIGFLGAYLLNITNTANSMILVGIISLIISLGLISYMKTRVGLKPSQYKKGEIYTKSKQKKGEKVYEK